MRRNVRTGGKMIRNTSTLSSYLLFVPTNQHQEEVNKSRSEALAGCERKKSYPLRVGQQTKNLPIKNISNNGSLFSTPIWHLLYILEMMGPPFCNPATTKNLYFSTPITICF